MLESVLTYCYRFQKLFVFVLKHLPVFLKCIFHYPVKSTRRNIKQYSSGKRLRNNNNLKHSPYCMPGTNKIRFSLKVQELINLNQTSTYAPIRILNTALIRSCHWLICTSSSQNTAHGGWEPVLCQHDLKYTYNSLKEALCITVCNINFYVQCVLLKCF